MAGEFQPLQLGKVCSKIGSGATPRGGKEAYRGGATSLIRSQNIYNDRFVHDGLAFIDDDQADELKSVVVEDEDVLLNITGDSVARCCQVDPAVLPARVNQHVAIIRPKAEILDARFLRYSLVSPTMQARLLALASAGATRNALTKGMLEALDITAPLLPEQRAIAHILGTLDDKIELNRQRNQTLEAMVRALFKDWFVDFGPVRARMEGREPYLPADLWQLFPDRLDDEGKPEGWKSFRLDDVLVLQRGFDLPASARTNGVYPVMAASGINGYHDKHMVKGPGITTGRSGVLGRVFLIHDDFWPLNTSLWVKEFKRVSPYYAFELLRGLDFEMFNAGSAVPTLNRNHVHNLPIVLPPRKLIDAFDEQVVPMRTAQKKNEEEGETLAQLRDTLLPKLISGELRIADAEKFLDEVGL
jgi:type I restriction enzyme, S subunit